MEVGRYTLRVKLDRKTLIEFDVKVLPSGKYDSVCGKDTNALARTESGPYPTLYLRAGLSPAMDEYLLAHEGFHGFLDWMHQTVLRLLEEPAIGEEE